MSAARTRRIVATGESRVPQQARSRRTRAQVVEAAIAVFEARGYDDATTAEIARRARVAVGSVYAYFPDKRAILLEILQDTVAQVADQVVAELDPELWRGVDARDRVRTLIETVFKARHLRPGVQRIVWERFFKDPEVREAMDSIERRGLAAIAKLLEALAAQGRARVQDIPTAAFVIHTSVEWIAARLVLVGAAESRVDAAVATTSEMISRLILGDA